MYAAFVTAVFAMMATVMINVAIKYDSRTETMREGRIRAEQARIAEGIIAFTDERGRPPSSLDELVATVGFEQLRSSRNEWQKYQMSGLLNDGTWRFERAASWTAIRKDGAVGYASENSCGSGGLSDAASWCGSPGSVWHRVETRERFSDEIAQEKYRQRRTLQLLADYWTTRQAFPRTGVGGQTLATGQLLPLPVLVGYSGTAATCTGVYTWMGLPFDCAALFDVWGNPVGYQFQNDRYVLLASEAPFSTADGQRVIVASPLNIQG
ncbi:hypothetical protein [Stenotrophomonas oahuensis]|uniref:Uncharacterized protein n=1 Tax=Stenotrophomonas oahuensis TaxID=3003271 RepID=A0ABY9YX83_9GAMM|nr:hypothetical protein [Stenotrophomonas sp. A5586]WNH54794.1 hypothetical protein PDM29_20840 [Stenotrophomonas sp. A5586]